MPPSLPTRVRSVGPTCGEREPAPTNICCGAHVLPHIHTINMKIKRGRCQLASLEYYAKSTCAHAGPDSGLDFSDSQLFGKVGHLLHQGSSQGTKCDTSWDCGLAQSGVAGQQLTFIHFPASEFKQVDHKSWHAKRFYILKIAIAVL